MFDLEIISAFLGNGLAEDCFQEAVDFKNQTQESLICQENGCAFSHQHFCDVSTGLRDDGRVSLDTFQRTNIVINTPKETETFESDSQIDSFCNKQPSPGNNSANETDSSASEESLFYGFYTRNTDSRFEFCDSARQSRNFDSEANETYASGEQTSQCCFHPKYSDTTLISDSESRKKLPNYVRMGATIRERTRMHMLNDAFDDLRKVIPRHNAGDHQRLSKIATLRLAIQYINALVSTLQTSGVQIEKANGHCVGDRRGKRRNSRKRFY